jgi:hypothetical protein
MAARMGGPAVNTATIQAIATAVPMAVAAERDRASRAARAWAGPNGYRDRAEELIRRAIEDAARLPQDTAVPVAVPVPQDDPEEEEQERTCECDACDDDHCRGDCDRCDDHDCEQCFGAHTVRTCCNYCEDCDSHTDGRQDRYDWQRCDQGHCHECDHRCEDY